MYTLQHCQTVAYHFCTEANDSQWYAIHTMFVEENIFQDDSLTWTDQAERVPAGLKTVVGGMNISSQNLRHLSF